MSDLQQNNIEDIDIKVPKQKISKRRRRFLIMRYLSIFNIIVITLIFVFGFSYLLFFKRETISNEENRKLASFPQFSISDYFEGKYTEGIAQYYDDTVHNRSKIKHFISAKLLVLKGKEYGDDGLVIYGSAFEENDGEKKQKKPVSTKPVTTKSEADNPKVTTAIIETTTITTTLPDINNPVANGEIANNIVVVNNRGLVLFGGGMETGKEYASYINSYKEQLGDNVNVYSMVCPTAVSYYMPENYLNLTASEKENIENINSALVNVKAVNIFDALLLHKNEDIYSRTDHHWQSLGAYYAAQAFAKEADVPFAELSEYEKVSLSGYVGTLYGYTNNASLINNPENFVYYIPKCNTTTTRYSTTFTEPHEDSLLLDPQYMSNSSYYMVFGGDQQITHVATDCKNGRNLVIFKDSYGNALLPFFTSSFENIYLCDLRYFDINAISFIKQVNATDLLFAMNTFSATGENHNYIDINRTK